jgi:methylphosphotriester-DNA--protein-cysteine methyltransferase
VSRLTRVSGDGFDLYWMTPAPRLRPFVDILWGVRGSAHYHVEAVLPNGATELMINLGPPQRVVAYGDREVDELFTDAWIAGIQDERLVHASPEGADHVAIRFRPGGAHAFFDVPMDELAGNVVELDSLLGQSVHGLRDRLLEAPCDEARCTVLEAWLLSRRLSVHPYFATVRLAMDLLRAGPLRVSVGEACERLGLSNRYLVKQFRTTVGLAPKSVARIERLQGVIRACRGRHEVDWSRMAASFGYADQSHLIRDFRRLSGTTPQTFLRRRSPDESNVILDQV